jgi:hypothetical protein
VTFEFFLASIEARALRDVALHWHEARHGRRVPGWKDIDPAAIAPHLPIVWAWKYVRDGDTFTGRLSGEEITAVLGKSVRGAVMREYFTASQYEPIFACYKQVMTEPAVAHAGGPVFGQVERQGTCERIVLPLADDGITGDGVIGATVYHLPRRPHQRDGLRIVPKLEKIEYFPL